MCDGNELKCTFRRVCSDELLNQWFDLVNILRLTPFSDAEDSLVWQYESEGFTLLGLYMPLSTLGAPYICQLFGLLSLPPSRSRYSVAVF